MNKKEIIKEAQLFSQDELNDNISRCKLLLDTYLIAPERNSIKKRLKIYIELCKQQ